MRAYPTSNHILPPASVSVVSSTPASGDLLGTARRPPAAPQLLYSYCLVLVLLLQYLLLVTTYCCTAAYQAVLPSSQFASVTFIFSAVKIF